MSLDRQQQRRQRHRRDVAIDINCADLGITKIADADPINTSDTAGFVITVTNNGDGRPRAST